MNYLDLSSVHLKLVNTTIATLEPGKADPYGLIENGVVIVNNGIIDWVGAASDLPAAYSDHETCNLEGRLLTPAFIDCHTHIIHGGHRAIEFEMRLEGASYEEIARNGGGIMSTVTATRSASVNDLCASALPRVDALLAEGVSVIEVKSGYGLDRDTELAMLQAARAIENLRPVRIRTSFLGAHAVPQEYNERPDAYIDEVCLPTLEAAHAESLVDAVDGFCEGIAFTTEQIERVFVKAQELGLPVKLHAEQLSHLGGTLLATRYAALSADHVEYATDEDAQAMAASDTVAVLLPGAFYTLHETQMPPIASFRNHAVPIALATDCNPGSSPMTSLLLAMNMACTLFRMTPAESLAGVTRHAAKALGLSDTGIIRAGMRADFSDWNLAHPAELSYRIASNSLHTRYFGGSE